MTEARARQVANLLLATAGVAVAYVVVASPPLRRFVRLTARHWLGASVPEYLLTETARAWTESAR